MEKDTIDSYDLNMEAFLVKPTLADRTAEPFKSVISCVGSRAVVAMIITKILV